MPKISKIEQSLEDIKKLIVLTLVCQGIQAKDIASVLHVDAAIISRMVPARKIKKVK